MLARPDRTFYPIDLIRHDKGVLYKHSPPRSTPHLPLSLSLYRSFSTPIPLPLFLYPSPSAPLPVRIFLYTSSPTPLSLAFSLLLASLCPFCILVLHLYYISPFSSSIYLTLSPRPLFSANPLPLCILRAIFLPLELLPRALCYPSFFPSIAFPFASYYLPSFLILPRFCLILFFFSPSFCHVSLHYTILLPFPVCSSFLALYCPSGFLCKTSSFVPHYLSICCPSFVLIQSFIILPPSYYCLLAVRAYILEHLALVYDGKR